MIYAINRDFVTFVGPTTVIRERAVDDSARIGPAVGGYSEPWPLTEGSLPATRPFFGGIEEASASLGRLRCGLNGSPIGTSVPSTYGTHRD